MHSRVLNIAHAVGCASKADDASQRFSRRSGYFDTFRVWWLVLYEYCLGLDVRTFYVDSRKNLFYRMLSLGSGP
jgi:hypothetical protein